MNNDATSWYSGVLSDYGGGEPKVLKKKQWLKDAIKLKVYQWLNDAIKL